MQTCTTKHRERREPWLPKWVRRCDSSPRLFQLRVPPQLTQQAPGKHFAEPVNFGLYPSPGAADRVGKMVRQHLAKGRNVWEALLLLIKAREVRASITCRFAYPVDDGWAVKSLHRGSLLELPGPFQNPQEAYAALKKALLAGKGTGRKESRHHLLLEAVDWPMQSDSDQSQYQ